ncbi:MAG: class I SAM-dependent methyltransferase [Nitrospirae bacterium]|nr:class I SAM-dependent methyltransferase [Nitrospirota bacterium]
MVDKENLLTVLKDCAREYPKDLIDRELMDVPRIAFNISLVLQRTEGRVRICDLGGGIGLFSVGCAAIGMSSILVDDFRDKVNTEFEAVPRTVHNKYNVEVINTDVIETPPSFGIGSFDVVTTFDSLEHWHHSPKPLFRKVMQWLKPNGLLIIGMPNCVNLRKRITVPLGYGKWSRMEDWYEDDRFRGHVREPDVADLRYIGADLGLKNIEILGRNWLGYQSRFNWVRVMTPLIDMPLRLFPALCSDLYLIGRKPS